jgi:hypothetical protein
LLVISLIYMGGAVSLPPIPLPPPPPPPDEVVFEVVFEVEEPEELSGEAPS